MTVSKAAAHHRNPHRCLEGRMLHSSRLCLFIVFISIMGLLAVVQEASAEFTLDVEVRQVYEDNVIGLVADNPNIISTTLNATSGEVVAGGGGTGTGTDKHGGQGGGGSHGLHMRKGGGELNDIPTPVTSTTTTAITTNATTSAAGGGGVIQQTAGDFSTDISVDAGYLHDVGGRTTLLLLAGVEHIGYSRYTQFDFTIAELSAGVAVNITDDLIGKALLRDAVK